MTHVSPVAAVTTPGDGQDAEVDDEEADDGGGDVDGVEELLQRVIEHLLEVDGVGQHEDASAEAAREDLAAEDHLALRRLRRVNLVNQRDTT